MNNNFSPVMTSSMLLEQSNPLVGFRFHPTDYELVNYFLRRKILCHDDENQFVKDIKVCDFEPWELPGQANIISEDQVWYFFCYRDYKYLRSLRSNRRTKVGFWKPTGKPRKVMDKRGKEEIGTKRSLVFYIKDHPKSIRTKWIMHEYEYIIPNSSSAIQGNFVLCKLKSKPDAENINKSEKHTEMTINSSCDECEQSINTDFDFENHNLMSDMTVADSAADDENRNPNEMTATSTYVNGKLDFENDQNPNTELDILASNEGEWSSRVPTPSDFDLQNQNQYEKIGDHTSTSSIAANVDSNSMEATPSEVDLQAFISNLAALLELDEEDNLDSATFPVMSPIESCSYASFDNAMLQ